MAVLMCGCVTQQPAPTMPKFTTDKGKACARECQATYAVCNQGCGISRNSSQREKCFNNCNQILGECYTTCE